MRDGRRAATIAASALVAQQVIGKATRDALFLSNFSVARLPLAMTAGTILSGAVAIVFTRLIARFGPARVVPRVFVLHAVVLTVEWILAQRFEPMAAVAVYLHTASLGAMITSAFWSVVSEAFDPHTGKRAIGRIGAGAALGGVIGGGVAWGGSRLVPVPAMLVACAALSLVSVWGLNALGRQAPPSHRAVANGAPPPSGVAAFRDTPYLRLLAGLVIVGGLLQALLDFTLGAQAKATYGDGARLLSFFALFQAAIGLVSFLLQTTANRPALDRLGIGGTIGLLPAAVAGAGALALAVPSLITAALQRGAEGVLRASLFRSAYEVLFTPLPQSLKRPTKTFIDVSLDRVGGLLGSGLTIALIALWRDSSLRVVTIASVLVAGIQIFIAYGLHRGYIATLADRLRSGALELDFSSVIDRTTRNTLSRTIETGDRAALLAKINEVWMAKSEDDVIRTIAQLRSNDPGAIRAALRRDGVRSPLLVPHVIELLSRDEVARDAIHWLAPEASTMVGLILDAVLDEQRDPRLRRRAARLLRDVPSQRVSDGLVLALSAESFDVRYVCARVLVLLRERNPDLRFDSNAMFARAKRQLEPASEDPRTVEHAFDLLSLAGPRESIQLAYGALQSSDTFLRGVALEYLDVVLPADVRAAVTSRLSRPPPAAAAPRTTDRLLSDLLGSKEAIRRQLETLRRSRDPDFDSSE